MFISNSEYGHHIRAGFPGKSAYLMVKTIKYHIKSDILKSNRNITPERVSGINRMTNGSNSCVSLLLWLTATKEKQTTKPNQSLRRVSHQKNNGTKGSCLQILTRGGMATANTSLVDAVEKLLSSEYSWGSAILLQDGGDVRAPKESSNNFNATRDSGKMFKQLVQWLLSEEC